MTASAQNVKIDRIKVLFDLQPRVSLRSETIEDYKDAMTRGEEFPPVEIVFDGTDLFLVDGFHRIQAAKECGKTSVKAIIEKGTEREAILRSVGANAKHGLPRTRGDKRRAVERLLKDPEWGKWSDREIAHRCRVSHPFVGEVRKESGLTGNVTSENGRKVVTKHGTETVMKTGNIGKNPKSPEQFPADYLAKYPVTAKCHELGCDKLGFVRPGLHTCACSEMRPENMNGNYPDECPQRAAGEVPASGDEGLPECPDQNLEGSCGRSDGSKCGLWDSDRPCGLKGIQPPGEPYLRPDEAPPAPKVPKGWHPSTNACIGCVVLGYERNKDNDGKSLYHVCTAVMKPPFGLEKCPLGTGPILKVGCIDFGHDTLCHNSAPAECAKETKKERHCPIGDFGTGCTPALDLMRRQQGRNPQSGSLTTDFCRMRECKDLKKRSMNNTLECSIAERVPGNMMRCPKDETVAVAAPVKEPEKKTVNPNPKIPVKKGPAIASSATRKEKDPERFRYPSTCPDWSGAPAGEMCIRRDSCQILESERVARGCYLKGIQPAVKKRPDPAAAGEPDRGGDPDNEVHVTVDDAPEAVTVRFPECSDLPDGMEEDIEIPQETREILTRWVAEGLEDTFVDAYEDCVKIGTAAMVAELNHQDPPKVTEISCLKIRTPPNPAGLPPVFPGELGLTIGKGLQKDVIELSQGDPAKYPEIIHRALEKGLHTLTSTPDEGDDAV